MEVNETALEKNQLTGSDVIPDLYRVAFLRERFASFIVDLLIVTYLILGWGLLLSWLLRVGPLAFEGGHRALFTSTSLGLYFIYYTLFEEVLSTTPGKILGGLIVHKRKGGIPSFLAILVRNLIRLIDYPLAPFTAALMEGTAKCRRLGDFVAGTIVLRKIPFKDTRDPKGKKTEAGATWRSVAFLLDLIFVTASLYGFLLLIPTGRKMVSLILLNSTPLFFLLTLSLSEKFFQTTFGKVLFGLKVVQEDGEPPSFALILFRNLFRPLDLPLGYLLILLSTRRQRIGDLLAGTMVIHAPRPWQAWLAIPYMLLIAVTLSYLGLENPTSFYEQEMVIRMGPFLIDPIPQTLPFHP